MEAEARYTYVGAALLLLVAALIGSVVWLKTFGARGDFNRYAIYFEHQTLDGLDVGSEVNLRGIKVGRVEDYALSGDRLNRVRVEVRIDRRAPIRTRTVAVVTRNFVTGIAAITLVNREGPLQGPGQPPGQAPDEALTKAPAGDDLPVIAEGRSDIDEITGRVNQLGEMASGALANFNELLSPDNRALLVDTIRSLRDLSAGLNRRLDTLDRTVARIGGAAQSVGSAAAQLGASGERIAAVAERAGTRLDATLAGTDQAVADARRALDGVARASAVLQQQAVSTARRLEDSAVHVDDQLDAAVSELRASVEAATRLLDGLRDPRAALLGPGKAQLGPGERMP